MIKVILFSLISLQALAITKKDLSLYNILIDEQRMIKKLKRIDQSLSYRLLELEIEKLKIIRKAENDIIIKKGKKESNYKKSKKQLIKIEKLALKTLNTFKNHKNKAEIYYSLGIVFRNDGKAKKSYFYLKRAEFFSHNKHLLKSKINLALAEHFYNEKKYKKSIKYYSKALKDEKDQWYTKHLYNLSWCYIQTEKKDLALEHIQKSYSLSQDKRYIDYSLEIMNSIGYFFSQSKKYSEGISFFLNSKHLNSDYILKYLEIAKVSLKSDQILHFYSLIEKHHIYKSKERNQIILSKINYLYNVKNFNHFFQEVKTAISDKKVSTDSKLTISKLLLKRSGYLQERLKVTNSKKTVKRVLTLLSTASQADPSNQDYYHYLKGETLYSVKMLKKSIPHYFKSINFSVKRNKKEFLSKSFDSLFSIITNTSLSWKTKGQIYKSFLKIFPKSEKSPLVFSEVISHYTRVSNFKKAVYYIKKYSSLFPKKKDIQRDHIGYLIEKMKDKKAIKALLSLSQILRKGLLGYDKNFLDKLSFLTSNLIFDNARKEQKNKNFKKAISFYSKIFEDKYLPQESKTISAINLSLIHAELDNDQDSLSWFKKASKTISQKEIIERRNNILFLSNHFFEKNKFQESIIINSIIIPEICSKPFPEKGQLLSNNTLSYNFLKDLNKIKKSYSLLKECSISKDISSAIVLEINKTNFYFNPELLFSTYSFFEKDHKNIATSYIDEYISKQIKIGNFSKIKNFLSLYNPSKEKEVDKKIYNQNKDIQNIEEELHLQLSPYSFKEYKEKEFFSWVQNQMNNLTQHILKSEKILSNHSSSKATELFLLYRKCVKKSAEKIFLSTIHNIPSSIQKDLKFEYLDFLKRFKRRNDQLFSINKNLKLDIETTEGHIALNYETKHIIGPNDMHWNSK